MNGSKTVNKKHVLIASVSLLLVLAIVLVIVFTPKSDEYRQLIQAIENTESKDDFILEFSSSAMIITDDGMQQTDSSGYIAAYNKFDDVFVHINTSGTSSEDSGSDFDVTVSMYTDGENVYEELNGQETPVDMSVDEFNDIVSEYGLYRYSESDVVDFTYQENELEIYEGYVEMTVVLDTPGKAVLDAYASKLSEITGEKVSSDDLTVTLAEVTYSIGNEEIAAQTCNFEVVYTTQSGKDIRYSSSSHILYLDFYEEESVDYIDISHEQEAL